MKSYRFSKYNPHYRINGRYIKEEWTDYSDVGKTFNGNIFYEEEYALVENKYILCILDILKHANIKGISIDGYEEYDVSSHWKNEQYVSINNLATLIRDCLRNKCWCRLKSNDLCIQFGYDYYVHIDTNLSYSEIELICNRYDLFLEFFNSNKYYQ